MDHLISTQADQICLTGNNQSAAMTEEKISTNVEPLTVDDEPITDEDDDHPTTDKNPLMEDRIQLAMSKKVRKPPGLESWKHFTKLNSKFALCRHCQRVISYTSTTHNLMRHLRSLHPSVLPKKENENDLRNINKEAGNKSYVKTKDQHNHLRRKRRSIIWNYFLESADKSDIRCKVCKCKFSYQTSTSNLLMHRLRVHPHLKTNYVSAKKPRKPENKNGREEKNEDAGNSGGLYKRFLDKRKSQYHARKRNSTIWNHFTRTEDAHITCNACNFKYTNKTSTANLFGHLIRKHPELETNLVPSESPKKPVLAFPIDEDSATDKVPQICDPPSDTLGLQASKYEECAPKNVSMMWDFFERVSREEARCMRCDEVICCKPTNWLYWHMRQEHPETSLNHCAIAESTASESDSDRSDVPDNFDPLDYYSNANYKRRQNRQQTDSMAENQESKTPTVRVKLKNDITGNDLNADEEMDAGYSTSLKESAVESRIRIKEEIMSEGEEIEAGEERLNLREECSFLSEFKQAKLLDFLIPALNSKKYGKLLFWGHEPDVFFIKWRHKSTRDFSATDLAVFQDWDALKGRTKAETDDDVVNTRQRLFSALKTRVRVLKSELQSYKKFKLLRAPKNVSKIWEFFKRVSREEARCMRCDEVLCCKPTHWLYRHMRQKHPETSLNHCAENTASESDSDRSDVPDNFDPLDYYSNANYKLRQNRQQTDSMAENQESKTPTVRVKLENDITGNNLNADGEMDAGYSMSLKESAVESRIRIKEEIMSEGEEIDAGEERLNLREECSFLSEFKQAKLLDFLIPALNSKKYGKLLFWGHEPDVFFIKWRHKSTRDFSTTDLAVFQDWDALKGRTKAETDDDVVNTRQRLFSALKTRVRVLKSELKSYKKFKLLNTTDRINGSVLRKWNSSRKQKNVGNTDTTDPINRSVLRKQNSTRKQKNVRNQRCQDIEYKNQRVKMKAESKDRFSRTHASISYKEASDDEEDGEEKEIPLKQPSRNSKTKISPTKRGDKTSNEFSSKKNNKDNMVCAKPAFHSSATEPSTSSTEKRSEDMNLITQSGGQMLKVKAEATDKAEASPQQVPASTSPKIAKNEDIKIEIPDTFTNVKTQGDMVVAMITTALPTLQSDHVSQVYNFLVDMGVENVGDLAFIEEEDMNKILKPVQSRKLIAAWKNKDGPVYSAVLNPACAP